MDIVDELTDLSGAPANEVKAVADKAIKEIKRLQDEIFNLKTEVHFDDQTIKSLQVINERLQRDVEEANARAYVMAKEVTLWQSRVAQKEGE